MAEAEKVETVDQQVPNAAMEAAFAASFADDGHASQAAKPDEVVKSEEANQDDKATPTAPPAATGNAKTAEASAQPASASQGGLSEDQIKLLAAIPELERRLTQQVDKVAGNYGEMKRLLEKTQKAAATPKGAAEFEASADGDYIDREFPELGAGVQEKIDRAMAKVPVGLTTDQLEAWYTEREEAKYSEAVKVLEAAHPDRNQIRVSPEWKQWVEGLPDYQRASVLHSQDPYYVSSMVSKFKAHRDKTATQADKSKQRIENAVTPTGVRPNGPSTISDDEAQLKAFEDQFK